MIQRLTFFILLFFIQTTVADNKPQRIVSLSLCTDQILLMLVEPERIAGISYLSKDPIYSYMSDKTEGLTIHHGFAEEIIPLKPDLIIGSVYTTNNSVQMLNALGNEVITLESPTTLLETEEFTRTIGKVVGEPEKAEAIIYNMHEELNTAKNMISHLPTEVAISYAPNGFTAGRKTLKHEIFAAAGYKNLAAELGIEYYGNLSVEQLLIAKPDVVVIDEAVPNENSLAQRYTTHPALLSLLGKRGPTRIPTNHWICPGPLASKAVMALVNERLRP